MTKGQKNLIFHPSLDKGTPWKRERRRSFLKFLIGQQVRKLSGPPDFFARSKEKREVVGFE
ncbi:MAG: hypothetical protein A2Y69_02015 [Candidatus Aminicenantes bacterium RBG_13_59_9]|nr:MAG: hypothetical protein A2Y69_02015 [Candidatus Aminicenantes bacterium RBG_13_59_9]